MRRNTLTDFRIFSLLLPSPHSHPWFRIRSNIDRIRCRIKTSQDKPGPGKDGIRIIIPDPDPSVMKIFHLVYDDFQK